VTETAYTPHRRAPEIGVRKHPGDRDGLHTASARPPKSGVRKRSGDADGPQPASARPRNWGFGDIRVTEADRIGVLPQYQLAHEVFGRRARAAPNVQWNRPGLGAPVAGPTWDTGQRRGQRRGQRTSAWLRAPSARQDVRHRWIPAPRFPLSPVAADASATATPPLRLADRHVVDILLSICQTRPDDSRIPAAGCHALGLSVVVGWLGRRTRWATNSGLGRQSARTTPDSILSCFCPRGKRLIRPTRSASQIPLAGGWMGNLGMRVRLTAAMHDFQYRQSAAARWSLWRGIAVAR